MCSADNARKVVRGHGLVVLIVKKRGGGERAIPPHKWFIDRYTPVGDDAAHYERMPYNGKRWIDPKTILRKESA